MRWGRARVVVRAVSHHYEKRRGVMWLRLPGSISASSADAEDSTSLSESQCQGLAAAATWRTMSRLPAFWRRVWKTARSTTLLSGAMRDHSQANSIVTEWLESLGASRVPITRSRGKGRVSSASTGNSGKRSEESFATFDPDGSLWRTSPGSLFHTASQGGDGILSDEHGRGISFLPDSGLFLETWPRSGSMRNGTVSPRPPLARIIRGTAWFLWPTPTRSDGTGGAGCSGRAGSLNLRTAIHFFKTPTASPWAHGGSGGELHKQVAPSGGPLSPTWVEWLMGFPIGWTDLQGSGTPSSPSSPSGSAGESSSTKPES